MYLLNVFFIVILLSISSFACHPPPVANAPNNNPPPANLALSNQNKKAAAANEKSLETANSKQSAIQNSEDWKEFNDSKLGISFQYPAKLKIQRLKNGVRIFHELKFEHSDPCDNSDNIKTLKKFADFDVTISVENKTPQISEECKNNSTINADAGYLDNPSCFATNNLKGEIVYKIYQGCGDLTYNFPLSNGKTLAVKRNLVPLLGVGAIPEEKKRAESLPKVILTDENSQIFFKIISTLNTKKGA